MFDLKTRRGYTLAEMLIVMGIFTVILLAMPPLTRKMFKVGTAQKPHGRMECYYNKDDHLIMYQHIEGEAENVKDLTSEGETSCEFTPPSNTVYIMVHAVGGGGAGKDLNTTLGDPSFVTATSYLSQTGIALWPDWFKHLIQNNRSYKFERDTFETRKFFSKVSLPYGSRGGAGERVSHFFPSLKNLTMKITPGKGGLVDAVQCKPTDTANLCGGNGGDTIVQFKYSGKSTWSDVIVAKGGLGGTTNGKYGWAITGGKPTDVGVSKMDAVKTMDSGFEVVLEDAAEIEGGHDHSSRINVISAGWDPIAKAGNGGNGAYHYLDGNYTRTSSFQYQVNNYSTKLDETGNTEQMNDWRFVTDSISYSIYGNGGQGYNCSSGSFSTSSPGGGIQVKAWCKPSTEANSEDYPYICEISHVTGPTATQNPKTFYVSKTVVDTVKTTETYKTLESSPSGYKNCVFNFDKTVTCQPTNSVPTHTCTMTGAGNFDVKNCLGYRESMTDESDYADRSKFLCKASKGGNGAVVILW